MTVAILRCLGREEEIEFLVSPLPLIKGVPSCGNPQRLRFSSLFLAPLSYHFLKTVADFASPQNFRNT